MKLKVEMSFKDKYTGELYAVDEVIEVDKDRADELLSDPRELVTVVKEEKKSSIKSRGKKAAK